MEVQAAQAFDAVLEQYNAQNNADEADEDRAGEANAAQGDEQ